MHVSSICSVKTLISSTFFKNTCDVILRRWGIFLAHFRFAISCLIHSKLKSLDDVTHKGCNLGLNGKFEKINILLKVPIIFFTLKTRHTCCILKITLPTFFSTCLSRMFMSAVVTIIMTEIGAHLTVWKIQDFSVTQILREIIFGKSRSSTIAVLPF